MRDVLTADRLAGAADRLLLPVGGILTLYQMVLVWHTPHGAIEHYLTHIMGLLVISSLIAIARAPEREGRLARAFYIVLPAIAGLAALGAGLNFYTRVQDLQFLQPFIGNRDLVLGIVLVAAVLILTGCIWGWTLAVICASAALYFAFGHALPAALAPPEQPLNVVVSFLAGIGGPRGILNYMPLSADLIFLLLVYGGALHGFGVIDMFEEVGKAIGNMVRGGVAYSAVVASLLIGMVTGQAVSNIALSGIMTIPTMARSGYTKEQASAIEVLASTGSQLLPPIMGLGAFLMAVILGVSYVEIIIAALIPGLLYVAAVAIGIAALIGSSSAIPYHKEKVDRAKIKAVAPSFLLSFIAIIVLLALRYSPSMAGFWGIVILGAMSTFRPAAFRPDVSSLVKGFKEGVTTAVQLGLILAAIGIVVQTLTTTGTGVSMGRLVADASMGSLGLGLIIGMLVSLFIGMGLPTPAAYALIAIVVVPALVDLGLTPLQANMFGFYFAIFSTLTPPVAVGILTAVRISGAGFTGTVVQCCKLGAICFLVPYLFVTQPGILDVANFGLESVAAIVVFLAATSLLAMSVYGDEGDLASLGVRAAVGGLGAVSLLVYLFTDLWPAGVIAPVVLAALMLRRRGRAQTAHG